MCHWLLWIHLTSVRLCANQQPAGMAAALTFCWSLMVLHLGPHCGPLLTYESWTNVLSTFRQQMQGPLLQRATWLSCIIYCAALASLTPFMIHPSMCRSAKSIRPSILYTHLSCSGIQGGGVIG